MSDYSGLMYAVGTPMHIYREPAPPRKKKPKQKPEDKKQKTKEEDKTLRQRSNSASTSAAAAAAVRSRSHNPFRHSRSDSGSQASRSSHDQTDTLPDRPATGIVGDLEPQSRELLLLQRQASTGDADNPRASISTGSTASTGTRLGIGLAITSPSPPPASSASSLYSFASRQTTNTAAAASDRRAQRPRHRPDNTLGLSTFELKNVVMYSEQEPVKAPATTKQLNLSGSFARTDSVSSTSGQTTASASGPAMASASDPSSSLGDLATKPFVVRSGRTFLNDPNLPYPLPADLTELHRQSLRTLLLIQVFGAPVCSPAVTTKPPQRVLEIGCGSGFWSMMCHRYFKGRGHGGISFTGIDIAPLAPGSAGTAADAVRPDRDMKWKFVQHDLRQFPWPLQDDDYDLVMIKDMSLAMTNVQHQLFIDEYIRVLRPGGTLEIWESDHTIRMLRPHVPSSDDSDEQEAASSLGAYIMSANTPLSPPLNTFLVEYNNWVTRALEARDLTPVPCTVLGATLLQEAETLADVRSRRLAIPLSEVRWEREGVGGVVTKDGKSYVEMRGRGGAHSKVERKTLTAGQAALRRTALLTVVQMVQALEPALREVSGKSLDEWDGWLGKMMGDLMGEGGAGGTSWGECLEVGAWWARKL